MTIAVDHGHKATTQQQQQEIPMKKWGRWKRREKVKKKRELSPCFFLLSSFSPSLREGERKKGEKRETDHDLLSCMKWYRWTCPAIWVSDQHNICSGYLISLQPTIKEFYKRDSYIYRGDNCVKMFLSPLSTKCLPLNKYICSLGEAVIHFSVDSSPNRFHVQKR